MMLSVLTAASAAAAALLWSEVVSDQLLRGMIELSSRRIVAGCIRRATVQLKTS
jgi:hypothetical protein